jgi:hypothetical protein
VHGTGKSGMGVSVVCAIVQLDWSFSQSFPSTVQIGVGLVILDHVVYVAVGYHSVTYALYWRPSRRGMLSQKVEVGIAGYVEKISVDVRVVVYDLDARLDKVE